MNALEYEYLLYHAIIPNNCFKRLSWLKANISQIVLINKSTNEIFESC